MLDTDDGPEHAGAVTAATLVAELPPQPFRRCFASPEPWAAPPEPGATGNEQIAALTGVAPMNRDSGLSRGQAHIAGGRMPARCLYMPCPEPAEGATVVAIRCNPVIRAFYRRLRDQGKPPKAAIVAAIRKLITAAISMLTHDRPWHCVPA